MAGRRNTDSTLGVLAAITVVAVAAILVLTQLRSRDPVAVPTTTQQPTTTTPQPQDTTPSPSPSAPGIAIEPRGEQPAWSSSLEVEGQVPLELLEHDGQIFLFTASPTSQMSAGEPRVGLQVWASEDPNTWELRFVIDDEYAVTSVNSTRFGLVASGYERATGDGLVWLSSDGLAWSSTVVSRGTGPNQIRLVESAIATEELVYLQVRGFTRRPDQRPDVWRALSEYLGGEISGYWLKGEGDQLVIMARGPFGIDVASVVPEAIGFTQSDFNSPDQAHPTTAWISRDGSTWEEQGLVNPPYSAFVNPQGRILGEVSATSASAAATVELAPNTLTWTEIGPPLHVSLTGGVHRWDRGLLGRPLDPQILYSIDGLKWAQLNPASLLPRRASWTFTAVGGSDRGIAIVGTSFGPATEFEPMEWSQDGYTIRVIHNGLVVIPDDEGATYTWRRWGTAQNDDLNVRWDPVADTITFLHPDTGDDLITLNVEETKQRLPHDGAFQEPAPSLLRQAWLFSDSQTWVTPGILEMDHAPTDWTIQDLTRIAPGTPTQVLVTSDRVILVTSREGRTTVVLSQIPHPR